MALLGRLSGGLANLLVELRAFLRSVCRFIKRGELFLLIKYFIEYLWCILFKYRKNFFFQGKIYYYFYHWHNTAWRNERSVEIPIIWEIVKKYKDKIILEVGNVLSHYYEVNYDIVDKYEKAEGVINEDVVNFHSSKLYDLIISISTLEHVGWDEVPREPMKILKAIENLKRILAPNGKIIALWIIHKVYFAFTLIVPTCPQTGEKQTNASSEEENSY